LDAHLKKGRLLISNIRPQVDCGRYRAKAVAGLPVRVSADIVREGTDEIAAVVRYRGPSRSRWKETPMAPSGNDRYEGRFTPDSLGVYRFTIEAYTDRFATWARDLRKRVAAGQDVDLELIEGATILSGLTRVPPKTQKKVNEVSDLLRTDRPSGAEGFEDPRVAAALDESIATLAVKYSQRTDASYSDMTLEVWVDRGRALFGAWYELFPRSTGRNGKHGTFATAIESLDRVAKMGFDIVYLPPIHPIGTTARKGRNNTLTPGKDDVGSPWAIGSSEGGHKEIHRGLGSFDDFDDFVAATRSLGMEVALDFAIQCSPDHPWVKQHPEWFHHRREPSEEIPGHLSDQLRLRGSSRALG
jgi:starch synthase (maltosyl-transferring)